MQQQRENVTEQSGWTVWKTLAGKWGSGASRGWTAVTWGRLSKAPTPEGSGVFIAHSFREKSTRCPQTAPTPIFMKLLQSFAFLSSFCHLKFLRALRLWNGNRQEDFSNWNKSSVRNCQAPSAQWYTQGASWGELWAALERVESPAEALLLLEYWAQTVWLAGSPPGPTQLGWYEF